MLSTHLQRLIRKRWGLEKGQDIPTIRPVSPPTKLSEREVQELLSVFRSTGELSEVEWRRRATTLTLLLIKNSESSDAQDISIIQLVHLLKDHDRDARNFYQKLRHSTEESHRQWWEEWTAEVRKIPADSLQSHALDARNVSWIQSAHDRATFVYSEYIGDDELRAEVRGLFRRLLFEDITKVVQSHERENVRVSPAETLLVELPPLLYFLEDRAVDPYVEATVAHTPFLRPSSAEGEPHSPVDPRWNALGSLRFAPPGPPLSLRYEALHARMHRRWTEESGANLQEFYGRARRDLPCPTLAEGTWLQLLDLEHIEEEGVALSWWDLLAARCTADFVERLSALLHMDLDWFDFDAPGEGDLPTHWFRVLELYGWSLEEIRQFFDVAMEGREDAEDWWEERVQEYGTWLASYPPPSDFDFDSEGDRSQLRGALHEGIDEAFGDVFSPHDPFSVREDS